jgi:hypothetical protein
VFFVFLGVVVADLGFLVSWLVLGMRMQGGAPIRRCSNATRSAA